MKKDSNTSAVERIQKELSEFIANKNEMQENINAEKAKIEELKKAEAECFEQDAFLKIRADIRTAEDKLAFLQKLASKPTVDEEHIRNDTNLLTSEQNKIVADALAEADKHASAINAIMTDLTKRVNQIQKISETQRQVYKTVYEVPNALFNEPTGKLARLRQFVATYYNNN